MATRRGPQGRVLATRARQQVGAPPAAARALAQGITAAGANRARNGAKATPRKRKGRAGPGAALAPIIATPRRRTKLTASGTRQVPVKRKRATLGKRTRKSAGGSRRG